MRADRVVVTGGASGLGAAVTARPRSGGAQVAVLDRREPQGPASNGVFMAVDLADSEAAHDATVQAIEALAGIDAVVTCAGIDRPSPLELSSWPDWQEVVAVNPWNRERGAGSPSHLLGQGHGHVVTVASTLGHRVAADATAYCASKFAVVGFTRALTAELRGRRAT